jgi:hypothetical protein
MGSFFAATRGLTSMCGVLVVSYMVLLYIVVLQGYWHRKASM